VLVATAEQDVSRSVRAFVVARAKEAYQMQAGEIGTWFANIWGAEGPIGTYWGGELATQTHQNHVAHGDPVAFNSSIELTRALS
jgi:hypothetical protein